MHRHWSFVLFWHTRSIVLNLRVTAYNVPFDFFKFLLDEPWNLDCIIAYEIMDLATDRIYDLADDDLIEDKGLQRRLLRGGRLRSGGQVDKVDRCVQGAVPGGSDEAGEDAAQGD